jgi:hypothetical protein
MREILDLAVEKALRAYIRTADRAGVTLGSGGEVPPSESSDELYEAQRTRAWG